MPRPVLLADEIERQVVEGDQLREPFDMGFEPDRPGAGGPPAELQVDADQFDEQSVAIGRARCRDFGEMVGDLARALPPPIQLEAEEVGLEVVVTHRQVARS